MTRTASRTRVSYTHTHTHTHTHKHTAPYSSKERISPRMWAIAIKHQTAFGLHLHRELLKSVAAIRESSAKVTWSLSSSSFPEADVAGLFLAAQLAISNSGIKSEVQDRVSERGCSMFKNRIPKTRYDGSATSHGIGVYGV
jgi:hypothetical protein